MMVELTYHINPNSVTLSSSDAGKTLSKRDDSQKSSFDYISFHFITQNDNTATLSKAEGLLWKWEVGSSFDNAPFHFATQDE